MERQVLQAAKQAGHEKNKWYHWKESDYGDTLHIITVECLAQSKIHLARTTMVTLHELEATGIPAVDRNNFLKWKGLVETIMRLARQDNQRFYWNRTWRDEHVFRITAVVRKAA